MTHPIIKTDNYILITSEEEIKLQDWCILFDSVGNLFYDVPQQYTDSKTQHINKYLRKVIAHLPLNNSPILEGVPLLPPLPNEEDVDKLAEKEFPHISTNEKIRYLTIILRDGFITGHKKAKEKYKFTEEDMRKVLSEAFKASQEGYQITSDEIISSLSQPKLPVGFNPQIGVCNRWLADECNIDCCGNPEKKIVINGVMQGQWIY